MCGFVGFVDIDEKFSPNDRLQFAKNMGDTIAHRGPDDHGLHDEPEGQLTLSFRRLSIIDRSKAGHQPMISASEQSIIVFNGEIYNAEEIKKNLGNLQDKLRGRSDTEIILEAFESLGVENTLECLNGMFAIAFYDRRTRVLTLVRDRVGKKPLYYGKLNKTFFFGSQTKAFSRHPCWNAEISRESLSAYMCFGYIPSPRSIYKEVETLHPGEIVRIKKGEVVSRKTYWDLSKKSAERSNGLVDFSSDELIKIIELKLKKSISMRLISDVPVGAFLSGGVDSSAIVSFLQEISPHPVKTFSIGFNEKDYDESNYAAAVSKYLKTDHHELILSPKDAQSIIPLIPEFFDEPFADASLVPMLLLSKFAREHVGVAMTGDGGDELFAGYERYQLATKTIAQSTSYAKSSLLHFLSFENFSKVISENLRLNEYEKNKLCLFGLLSGKNSSSSGYEEKIFKQIVGQWHAQDGLVVGANYIPDKIWNGFFANSFPELTRRFQTIDAITYLPDDILVKVDRASMAMSLEARCPFLDYELMEFTFGLPEKYLVRDGITKWILRECLYKRIPRELIDRPKVGFMLPLGEWLRGPLRGWAEELLNEKKLKEEGYLNSNVVHEYWRRHLSGRDNWQYRLWCILMFQSWKNRWV